jgi:hypothetical protein
MKPCNVDFEIQQGEDFEKIFTVKHQDGSAFNFTGYTGVLQARESIDDDDTVLVSGAGGNITLTLGGVAGTITLTMTDVQTSALDFVFAEWQIELTAGTTTKRWFEGVVSLSKEVVR